MANTVKTSDQKILDHFFNSYTHRCPVTLQPFSPGEKKQNDIIVSNAHYSAKKVDLIAETILVDQSFVGGEEVAIKGNTVFLQSPESMPVEIVATKKFELNAPNLVMENVDLKFTYATKFKFSSGNPFVTNVRFYSILTDESEKLITDALMGKCDSVQSFNEILNNYKSK